MPNRGGDAEARGGGPPRVPDNFSDSAKRLPKTQFQLSFIGVQSEMRLDPPDAECGIPPAVIGGLFKLGLLEAWPSALAPSPVSEDAGSASFRAGWI